MEPSGRTLVPARTQRTEKALSIDSENQPMTEAAPSKLIAHFSHHKVVTKYVLAVLKDVAAEFGLKLQNCKQEQLRPNTDIFFSENSWVDLCKLPPYVGSHIIRDPRDIIVSGYFYHQWTKEAWCNTPWKHLGGLTYKQFISQMSKEDGIACEMQRIGGKTVETIAAWDYHNPNILEIHYEDLFANPDPVFASMFRHYGFSEEKVSRAVTLSDAHRFEKATQRKPGEENRTHHARKGLPGDWQNHFSDNHKRLFKEKFGDLVVRLGYEKDNNW
jgi:hypothetical protein